MDKSDLGLNVLQLGNGRAAEAHIPVKVSTHEGGRSQNVATRYGDAGTKVETGAGTGNKQLERLAVGMQRVRTQTH